MREFPAELTQNLQAYLAEHAGLSRYYLSELASLRTRYGVTTHEQRTGDEGYPDGIELAAFGRTFVIRDQVVTEERLWTAAEADAERARLAALAEHRAAYREKLEAMAASGDAEARRELEILRAGEEHMRDLERAMLVGRVW